MKPLLPISIFVCFFSLANAQQVEECDNISLLECGLSYSASTNNQQNNFVNYGCQETGNTSFNGNDQLLKVQKANAEDRLTINIFNNMGLDLFLLEDCSTNNPSCVKGRAVTNQESANWIIETEADNWSAGTYGVVVDAASADVASDYIISTSCGRLDCSAAVELKCNQVTSGNTDTGENNISAYKFNGQYFAGNGGKELLYYFDITETQEVTIDMSIEATSDIELFLLKSCDEFDCIGRSINGRGTPEQIVATIEPGRYYLLLDGYGFSTSSFELTLNASCATSSLNCEAAIPIKNGQGLEFQDFADESNNISTYPCGDNAANFNGKEKTYTFTLDNPGTVSIDLKASSAGVNDNSAGFFLVKDCEINTNCIYRPIDIFRRFAYVEYLEAGTYYIVIEEGGLREFDIYLSVGHFNICDVGGTFINNGVTVEGKLTNRDFPLLDVPRDDCIRDNHSIDVDETYFFDTYIFYYDPQELGALGGQVNSDDDDNDNAGELSISVYKCGCDNPQSSCESVCLDQGSNVDVQDDDLEEGFYYFVVSGIEGTNYTILLIPEGPCDDIATPIECNSSVEGNFNNVNNNGTLNYSCYTGDRNYSGNGAIFSFTLEENSNVSINLSANNEPLGLFLFGPNCGESCLNFTEVDDGGSEARIDTFQLIQGIYYIVVDKEQITGTESFTISITCGTDLNSPIYFSSDCPVLDNDPHKVTFLGLTNTTISEIAPPDNSRIAFFHTVNNEGWLELTAEGFWQNGESTLMSLAKDDPNDGRKCSYEENDNFLMKIQLPSDDLDYEPAITFQGTFLAGGDINLFKSGGESVITDIQEVAGATISYLNINVNSICVPAGASTFNVELSSNIAWRIEEAFNSPWVSADVVEGVGQKRIVFSFTENNENNRTENIRFIGNDGSLRTLSIVQKKKCPEFTALISQATAIDCNNPTVQLNATTSETPGSYTINWQVADGGNITQGANTLTPTVNQSGTYTLVISNGTCEASSTIQVQSIAPPNANVEATNALCNGVANGKAQISMTSGTPEFSIQWPDGNTSFAREDLAAGSYIVTIQDAKNCVINETIIIGEPTDLQASFSATGETSVAAKDGTATIEPSGGTGQFSYNWSNGQTTKTISNLAPGSYSGTVTDTNGCQEDGTVTVSEFACAGFTIILEKSEASCSNATDGSANISTSGSTGTLSFQWSNDPNQTGNTNSNLAPGDYVVSVTDGSGCSQKIDFEIKFEDKSPPNLRFQNITLALNANGIAQLAIQDVDNGSVDNCAIDARTLSQEQFDCNDVGQNPIVFSITDVNGNTASSTVIITVEDNISPVISCPENITTNSCIVNYDLPTATDNCGIESINMLEGLEPGSSFPDGTNQLQYQAIDQHGKTATCSFSITVENTLAIDNSILTEPTAQDETNGAIDVTIIGGTPPYTFQWLSGGVEVSTQEDLIAVPKGVYSLIVRDAAGCEVTSQDFNLEEVVAVNEPEWASAIRVFPNPSIGQFYIDFGVLPAPQSTITVFNLLGKEVIRKFDRQVNRTSFDLSDLSSGIYFIKIEIDHRFITRRVFYTKP